MFTKHFDAQKWAEVHSTHKHGGDDPHPTGFITAKQVACVRTFHMKPRTTALLRDDEYTSVKTRAMLKMWLFRFAKYGHIAMPDSMEMTVDGTNGHLIIFYLAYNVPPEWSCIYSSRVVHDAISRREEEDHMQEAIKVLHDTLGIDDEAPQRDERLAN